MRLARPALLASLFALVLAMPGLSSTTASPPAGASAVEAEASACPDSIRMGGKRFAFYKHRVTCTGARTAVRELYASYGRRGTPRGFRCGSKTRFRKSGGCRNRARTRFFGYSR